MHDEHRKYFHAYRPLLLISLGILVFGGLLLTWIWNGPGSAITVHAKSFVITRDADKSWPKAPAEEAGLHVSLDISERKITSKVQSNQRTSAMQGARLACRSVAFFNTSPEPLTHLIAQGIITGLQEDPEIQRISYIHGDDDTTDGAIASDIVISLNLDQHEDDTSLGEGEVTSKAKVKVADQIGSGFSMDPIDVVRKVAFTLNIESKVTTLRQGITTPNEILMDTASDLAGGILDKIRDSIQSMRRDYGSLRALPEAFYPDFVAVDTAQFDLGRVFTDQEPFQRLASWHDKFLHNCTWWHGTVHGDRPDAMQRITNALIDDGFEALNDYTQERTFKKGAIEITLRFESDRIDANRRVVTATTPLDVRYIHRATPEWQRAAFDSVIDSFIHEDADPELLLTLLRIYSMKPDQPRLDKKQRLLVESLFEARTLTDPQHLLARAKMFHGRDEAGAADDLIRAAAFAKASLDNRDLTDKIEEQAEDWQVEIDAPLANPEWLRDAGMTQLFVGADPIEAEVTLQAPLRCFYVDDQEVSFFTVGLHRDEQGQLNGAYRAVRGDGLGVKNFDKGSADFQLNLDDRTFDVSFPHTPKGATKRVQVSLR